MTMARFLDQLYQEHRMIAAVLHGMRYLVDAHRSRGVRVDPRVFEAMIYYLDVFPERSHHRKEEQYLFASLRQRAAEADAALRELTHEHHQGADRIRRLEQAFVRYREGGEAEFEAFGTVVDGYVEGYLKHMREEESEIMPLAERVLTREDWVDIEVEFALDRDPLHDADPADYQKLFSRIVNLAPPPIGVGPSA